MQALGHLLTEVLGNVRLEVPPWQRRYSWDERNWEAMWQSVSEVADSRSTAQHFLGALVFQRGKQGPGMTVHHRIIDGQQRLITISLVLATVKRRLAAYPVTDKRKGEIDALSGLLFNPGRAGQDSVKVIPYGSDLALYMECLSNDEVDSSGQLADAFDYFTVKVSELKESRLLRLRDGMAGRFYFAAVYLDDKDDANRIFRSLNEAGMTLVPTDHIRNNLFMSAGSAGDLLYVTHWQPLEQLLGSNDALLSFLFAEQARQDHHANTIRKNQLQLVYAKRFEAFTGNSTKLGEYLATIRKNGTMYKALGEPQLLSKCDLATHAKLQPSVARLAEWSSGPSEITTLDILVRHRDGEIQLSQATRALHSVESFLVRRFLTGQKANLLSRIFTDLIAQFPAEGTYSSRVRAALSWAGHSWPTDAEVQRSVSTVLDFYIQGAAAQRRYILKQLDQHALHGKTLKPAEIGRAWPSDLTIEHIMPVSLDAWWRSEVERERQENGWDESVDELHAAHVNLLGNLTLARQARNVQYANKPFSEKIALVNQQLTIRLNSELGVGPYKKWGIGAIRKRSQALSELACAIWEGPSGR